jgi:hypothetical protein
MSHDFTTTCPHCGENHSIPYQDVKHHIYRILGQESARKRKDFAEHMQKMHRGHRPKLSTVQQAILALSQQENLDDLKLREIADKIGVSSKNPVQHVWKQIDTLRKKGLLSYKRRVPAFPVQQI